MTQYNAHSDTTLPNISIRTIKKLILPLNLQNCTDVPSSDLQGLRLVTCCLHTDTTPFVQHYNNLKLIHQLFNSAFYAIK